MRHLKYITGFLLVVFCGTAHADELLVSRESDSLFENGTLRAVLNYACDTEEDDTIVFTPEGPAVMRIELEEPMVIPHDCQGTVTIQGAVAYNIIIDGSPLTGGGSTPGDSCLLHVYSSSHTIKNLVFVGNTNGAGVCLFGQNNTVENCRFGEMRDGGINPNKYGVVISNIFSSRYPSQNGRGNSVVSSYVGPGSYNGIWGYANDGTIRDTQITGTNHAGIVMYGNNHNISDNQVPEAGNTGIVVYGDDNHITDNVVSSSGRYGLRLEGDNLFADRNEITSNRKHGIWIRSQNSRLSGNTILANGGCPADSLFDSQDIDCLIGGGGGAGIFIAEESRNLMIGGDSFEEDHNTIQYNRNGGILIPGDEDSREHNITRNTISKNYDIAIDLGDDGITSNDLFDEDMGPNLFLNHMKYFQAFPLVPSAGGDERYWGWGINWGGGRVELYRVSGEEIDRGYIHGGGDFFLERVPVLGKTFNFDPADISELTDGDYVTALSFDYIGNTSEFSLNVPVGDDEDLDGIPDFLESGDNPFKKKDKKKGEWEKDKKKKGKIWDKIMKIDGSTSPSLVDTDRDGMPDSVEDRNRNGDWDRDLDETSGYLADSDADGLSDWAEVHGDGIYDPGVDTNPLVRDTDGDGLLDGREDPNNNGIWEGYLSETNALLADSDGDGFNDHTDTCPAISNPGQEPWYCW